MLNPETDESKINGATDDVVIIIIIIIIIIIMMMMMIMMILVTSVPVKMGHGPMAWHKLSDTLRAVW
jgi:flagellar basal body-associated protein FliL